MSGTNQRPQPHSLRPPSRETRPHIRLNSNPNDILDGPELRPPRVRGKPQSSTSPSAGQRRSFFRPGGPNRQYYANNQGRVSSQELLLPPRPTSRSNRRYRDISPAGSFNESPPSTSSSRRSSVDSTSSFIEGKFGPYSESPDFLSVPGSRSGSREGFINTQTVSEKYNITPSAELLIYPNDVEQDDWLHTPMPGEKDTNDCNIFTKRGAINVGGLSLITLGILILFIGFPILTFVKRIDPQGTPCADNPLCISDTLPLLTNIRQGLIDPDTPSDAMTRTARDGSTLNLVFSDEFNTPGRSFYDNDDPFFQAMDLWYGATQDLEWYDPDALTTVGGALAITFSKMDPAVNHNLSYRSGMLQSWNKLCFKGGYIEASISLPGSGNVSGFWPGFWTMGNLGRPGYLATTEGMWPYSYDNVCDAGITPNQSSSDGLSWLPGMKLPACTCPSAQHPSPGLSRSAPEIDAVEALVVSLPPNGPDSIGGASQSFQVAPFDIWYQPNYDFVEVYDSRITSMNTYRGGPYQQSFSGLSNLNNNWYNGQSYQVYGFEYEPGGDGYIQWFVGQEKTWALEGASIGPNGNVGQRIVPEEPMSIIANFGMANSFSYVEQPAIDNLLPATMRIDYIRVYQGSDHEVTCDPEGYPTTEYISQFPKAYINPQETSWTGAGYNWPKNDYMHSC